MTNEQFDAAFQIKTKIENYLLPKLDTFHDCLNFADSRSGKMIHLRIDGTLHNFYLSNDDFQKLVKAQIEKLSNEMDELKRDFGDL